MAVSKSQSSVPFIPDDRQREAIEHVHGPMLVIAGAGTGKTSVLINRIARLVEQGHAQPEEVLALTYTVAAATEMRERVCRLVGKPIRATTFHDYCLDLLKRAKKDFGVLDEKDLWIFLRKRIPDLHLEHYVRAANVGQFLNPAATTNWSHRKNMRSTLHALSAASRRFTGLQSRKSN